MYSAVVTETDGSLPSSQNLLYCTLTLVSATDAIFVHKVLLSVHCNTRIIYRTFRLSLATTFTTNQQLHAMSSFLHKQCCRVHELQSSFLRNFLRSSVTSSEQSTITYLSTSLSETNQHQVSCHEAHTCNACWCVLATSRPSGTATGPPSPIHHCSTHMPLCPRHQQTKWHSHRSFFLH
jgi:hypothetical protein